MVIKMLQLGVLLLCVPLQLSIVYFSSNIEKRIREYSDYVNSALRESDLGNVLVDWFNSDTIETRSYETDDTNRGTIRSHRPEQVFLRVGFVVLHIQLGYTGVIIGWRVSDDGEPIYEVLMRHPEIEGLINEAAQTSLYPLQYTYILHPELGKYFEAYNGASQYTPLPWLRNMYPLD